MGRRLTGWISHPDAPEESRVCKSIRFSQTAMRGFGMEEEFRRFDQCRFDRTFLPKRFKTQGPE
jgi:hypothetical protein